MHSASIELTRKSPLPDAVEPENRKTRVQSGPGFFSRAACGLQIVSTVPPSTRNAAPVVADARGEAA